jgi:hypothetical protein
MPDQVAGPVDGAVDEVRTVDFAAPDLRPPPDAGLADGAPADSRPEADLPPGVPGCPADPDLLLCFRFEGMVKDESPYRFPATQTGVVFAAGRDGLAASVSAGAHVRVLSAPVLTVSRYTVEASVFPRSLPQVGERAGVVDNNLQHSIFIYPGGTVRCGGGTDEVRVAGLVKPGVWASLACTFEPGQQIGVWLDGVLKGAGKAPPALTTGNDDTVIGKNDPAPGALAEDAFDGLIDNVRLWRKVLPAAQLCTAATGCP